MRDLRDNIPTTFMGKMWNKDILTNEEIKQL